MATNFEGRIRLGDVVNYIRGITFAPEDKLSLGDPGSVVCMRTKNIQEKLDETDLLAVPSSCVKRTEQYLQTKDILVSSANSWNLVGKCVQVPSLGYVATAGGFISIVRRCTERIDGEYLYRWLAYEGTQYLVRQCARQTTNIANLDVGQFLNIELSLPSLPEQQRIASILSRADRLRRLRRYALEMSESYLQAVFLEMFGDPATNPLGWEMHRLGKHIKFLTSGPRGWADYYSDSGVRFIRSLDVQMNRISEENPIYVRPPVNAEASRTRVRPDDVLLTITGSRIGRVAPVSDTIGEAYVSQHVAIIRMDATLRPDFVSMFLSHPRGGQEQIARFQYGQTKPGLNLEQIRAFEIQLPPQREQERYSQASVQYDRLRVQQREALRQAEHLFQTLLYGAFRGEV